MVRGVTLLGETPGVLVAAVSYPFTGDLRPSKGTFFRQIPKIRAAFLDTPPALMLALDYLLSRPDVDSQRVEGVGVSLGAPFMTIAGALDSRFRRVWAIHGSGGSYAPLEANMKRMIAFKPARAVAAGVANVIIAGPYLAPERWVSRISPRPFIMVNARRTSASHARASTRFTIAPRIQRSRSGCRVATSTATRLRSSASSELFCRG